MWDRHAVPYGISSSKIFRLVIVAGDSMNKVQGALSGSYRLSNVPGSAANKYFPLCAGFSLLHQAVVKQASKFGVFLHAERGEDGELFVGQHQRHHLVLQTGVDSLGDQEPEMNGGR